MTRAASPSARGTVHGDGTTDGWIIPGWVMRLAYAATIGAVTALSLLVAPGLGPGTAAGFGLVLVAIGAVVAPSGTMPLALLAAAILYRLAAAPQVDGGLVALAALIPAAHQLAAIVALVPARARVPPSALRPAALRWIVAVAPTEIALTVVGLVFA